MKDEPCRIIDCQDDSTDEDVCANCLHTRAEHEGGCCHQDKSGDCACELFEET